jgi:hypothetical protein
MTYLSDVSASSLNTSLTNFNVFSIDALHDGIISILHCASLSSLGSLNLLMTSSSYSKILSNNSGLTSSFSAALKIYLDNNLCAKHYPQDYR